ncbi:MAG: 6-phosphogluconolactonase [Bacteroidales bacterium]|nr:6-phosphogluconolactonase [Bacteroidales bacterium]
MNLRIFPTIDKMSDFLAEEIISGISSKAEDEFFTLSLSGGNTPKSVFQHISKHYSCKIIWDKVKIFWGDERCVAPENKESNYGMAKKFLLDNISIPEKNIFRICGECDPHKAVENYHDIVKNNVVIKDSFPSFDLFMLGIGPEGHTASIFPDRLSLFESKKWFDVALHPETGQKRITATGKVINNSHQIFFIVAGDEKKDILNHIITKEPGWENLPAAKVKAVNGSLYWLVDEAAANTIS